MLSAVYAAYVGVMNGLHEPTPGPVLSDLKINNADFRAACALASEHTFASSKLARGRLRVKFLASLMECFQIPIGVTICRTLHPLGYKTLRFAAICD